MLFKVPCCFYQQEQKETDGMKTLIKTTALLSALIIAPIGDATASRERQNEAENYQSTTVRIEEGNVIDLISGIRKAGTEELQRNYFSQVGPLAGKHGFRFNGTFVIEGPPTKGNYEPDFFGISSWPGVNNRNQFRSDAQEGDYDYISERRKIWSVFKLTEYGSRNEPLEFTLRSDKVYVITTYWIDDLDAFRAAKRNASVGMQAAGGKFTALITGRGHSKSGYLYEPDVVSITEWSSREEFERYNQSLDHSVSDAGVGNVYQWVTRFLFR